MPNRNSRPNGLGEAGSIVQFDVESALFPLSLLQPHHRHDELRHAIIILTAIYIKTCDLRIGIYRLLLWFLLHWEINRRAMKIIQKAKRLL